MDKAGICIGRDILVGITRRKTTTNTVKFWSRVALTGNIRADCTHRNVTRAYQHNEGILQFMDTIHAL